MAVCGALGCVIRAAGQKVTKRDGASSLAALAAPLGSSRSLGMRHAPLDEPQDLRREFELLDCLAQLDALAFRVVTIGQRSALMPDEQLRGAFRDLSGLHGLSEGVAQRMKDLSLFA
jgi:hypothetical protein